VLVISEDLGEILEMCDRVTVIAAGRLSPSRNVSDTGAERSPLESGMFPTKTAPPREAHGGKQMRALAA